MNESAAQPVPEHSEQPVESAPRRRRRRRSRSSRSATRRRRLRTVYFTLASVWGFATGTAAILGGLAAVGRPLTVGPQVAMVLMAATVVALLGGVVASRAYREAADRS